METDFKSQQMDFDSWRREEGEILGALAEAREMAKWSKSPSHNGPTSTSSNSSSAPNESKESSAPKKEENVPTLQEMRSAALKEYEAIQAKLRAKQPTAAPASSDPEAESAPTSKVADPHQAEKDLCQELIAYCKSNMPAEPSKDSSPKKKKKKRKKKKIRLTHK